MTKTQLQTLAEMKEQLHISHSQISCYLNCPLKYMFRYVQGRPPERISAALPFGTAIHAGIELYYLSHMSQREIAKPSVVEERFADSFSEALSRADAPVIYKKDETMESLLDMGKAMIKTFCRSISLENTEVIGVETPLTGRLYTDDGKPTDFAVIGVVDALIRDEEGIVIAIDHKTAARAKQQKDVDFDLQLSAYSYLLASNKIVGKADDLQCRLNVIRKLKRPKLEIHNTVRTSTHRRTFAKIACQVLHGIENQVFYPVRSWMCTDCAYTNVCLEW
jgi:putative RecB family exonuclease